MYYVSYKINSNDTIWDNNLRIIKIIRIGIICHPNFFCKLGLLMRLPGYAILRRRNTWFNQVAEDRYAVYIFGIHQTIYGTLTIRKPKQCCNRKPKNFENIISLSILYKSVTKIRKLWVNPQKCEWRENAIPIRFTKKLNNTFTSVQFSINGFFVPHSLYRNDKGGWIFLYVRETLIVFPLKMFSLPSNIEEMFFWLNLRSKSWLLCCSYNPHKNLLKKHLKELIKAIMFYSKTYDNFVLVRDHNAQVDETKMVCFWEIYELRSLIDEHIGYKIPLNPSCTELSH